MTHTRAIDAVAVREAYDVQRDDLQLALSPTNTVGARPWAELQKLEIFPGSRLGEASIVVPEHYLPTSATRRLSFRTLKLSDIPYTVDRSVDESLRRALLALWLPRQTATGTRVYKPAVWLEVARKVTKVAGWIHDRRGFPGGRIFSDLTRQEVERLLADCRDDRERSDTALLLRNLREAGDRGLLNDYPRDLSEAAGAGAGEFEPEALLKDISPVGVKPRAEESTWLPFPDDFVTELLGRAFWIQDNLAEPILKCWRHMRQIGAEGAALGRKSGHPSVIEARRKALAAFEWKDVSGRLLTELPFPTFISSIGNEEATEWPPASARAVASWVVLVQAMNLCTIAFSTGARSSELASATTSSLASSPDGDARFAGTTFKLSNSLKGQARDWPLHPAAVQAMRSQMALSAEVRPQGDEHLWVLAGRDGSRSMGTPLLNLTEPVVNAVKMLGLTAMAGDDRPHVHRWRHTVARLVALSVTSAPQVLLDLFGHRDLEMTLRYMLSDPEIARDAIKVAEEASIVLAEEAIGETLQDLTSGPGAISLRNGLVPLDVEVEPRPSSGDADGGTSMRSGDEEYGAPTLREAAEILTLNGRFWSLVRPGVICTKTLGQLGPCTQGRGDPDPGACRTGCDHRLELALAQTQCRQAVDALLVEHAAALTEEADFLVENLEGQIKANLKRWDAVRDEVLARSDVARRIWTEAA